jgi:nucleotide-binding universal stress UspA family protein
MFPRPEERDSMVDLPRHRRILLATDGSSSGERACRHGVSLAQQLGAALTVLYTVDTHLAFTTGIHRDDALRELRRDGELALETAARMAREAGVPVQSELCEGRPGEMILEEAARAGADMIVVGSHGQGALTDILLGSVSQYVVHHADIPVCIVSPPPRSTASGPGGT